MFPYILLIILPFLFSYVAKPSVVKENGKIKLSNLRIGKSEYVKNNNMAIFMFFLIFFLILSFRDVTIGRDVFVYEMFFEQYRNMSYIQIMNTEGDVLYSLLNWLVGKITDNFQLFLGIVSAITLFPVYIEYTSYKRHSFMKVVLFMNMSVFIMFFSGLRQSLAIAIGMIAYEFVKTKKIIPFLITVLIAIGMHHSAFVLFLMYPFYHLRLKKVTLIFIIPLTLVIYIYNKTIFVFLSNIINQMSDGQYEAEISSTGAFTMIVLLILFLALSYFLPDETLIDDETLGLRNLLIVALWFQFFAPLHSLAMRFNYYYIIFIPMLIPRIIQHSKVKYRKIGKMAEIVITVYFLYYYLSHTYSACVSGISALDTYPYVPFWKN